MGFENFSGRRIYRPRYFCHTKQKGLDRMVCQFRHFQHRNSCTTAFCYRAYRYNIGYSCSDQTGSPCSFMDDIVGILDRFIKTDCWYACLGLCRKMGQLGRSAGSASFDRLAEKYSRMAEMKIFAKVKPNSKKEEVERIDVNHFEIRVKAMPQEGKANMAVINALAKSLDIPKSRLKIVSGEKSKQKILEIK